MALRVDLLLDDGIRKDLIKFVREQVRPLVKEAFNSEVLNAGSVMARLIESNNFKGIVEKVLESLLRTQQYYSVGSPLRELVVTSVRKFVDEWFITSDTYKRLETNVRGVVSEMVRAELRKVLGEK